MSNPPVAVLWGDLNMLRCFSNTSVPTLVLSNSPEEPVLRSRHCRTARVITSPKNDPDRALSDGAQSMFPAQFERLMAELRIIAPAIGRSICLEPVARRGWAR